LVYKNGRWCVLDGDGLKHSTNGTWVLLDKYVKVHDRMLFRAGKIVFTALLVNNMRE